ncbi:MAG: UvrD-helicase domain-containing protein, partial [Solobacterium sp.]|nr:UvrD-helicase domain-containing protein [Solobacterium sp.]
MSILDAQARHAITHEVDQNIFVEAGAGSGKTTILVARLLTMVKSGIDVSKICAITFTKAAALEFYKRFQARLLQEKKKDDLSAKERGYIEQALKDLDLCFMGTIDAFCSTLLNEHPIEAKVPSFSAVIDDEEREKLYERINMEILNGEYDKVDPSLKEKGLKAKSLFYDDAFNRILLDSLTHIMDSRDSEFIYDEPTQSIDDVLGRKKKEMQDFASYMRGKVNLIHHTASGQADYDKLIMSLSILSRSDWNARLGDIRDALK